MQIAERMINMKSVSPLASAIADIVRHSEGGLPSMTTTKMAMLGAVFGAYAAHSIARSDDGREAVFGATAGAIAGSTSEFLQTVHQNDSWMSFLQRD
jgi:hypothetical protein